MLVGGRLLGWPKNEKRAEKKGGCRMVFLVLRYNEDSNRVVASAQKGTNRG